MKHVYPYGAFDIENPKNDNVFKINGHRLKVYFDNFLSEDESTGLSDPVIKIDYFIFLTLFLCFFCAFVLLLSLQPRSNGE